MARNFFDMIVAFADENISKCRKAISELPENANSDRLNTEINSLTELKNEFNCNDPELKVFSSVDNTADKSQLKRFAILKRYFTELMESDEDINSIVNSIIDKMESNDANPNVVTSIINHLNKLLNKDYDKSEDECYLIYDEMLSKDPELSNYADKLNLNSNNVVELLEFNSKDSELSNIDKIRALTDDPEILKCCDRLEGKIAEEAKVKCFSRSDVVEMLTDDGYIVSEVGDNLHISTGDKSMIINVEDNEDGTVNIKYEDENIDKDNLVNYIKDKLNEDQELEINIDPDTGNIIN